MLKKFNKARNRCLVIVDEEINAVFGKKKTQKWQKKNKNFLIFYFYAILVKFSIDSVDENVENAQHSTDSLSSRRFRKHNCCFLNEKSKLTPKMTKIPKFSNFQRFYAFFPKFSTHFVDCPIWKASTKEGMCCPVGFFEKFIAVFFVNTTQIDTENFQIFKVFMQSLLKFRQTSLIRIFWKVNKETFDCPVVFIEEIIAMFRMKCLKLTTKMTKIPEFINFQSFYEFFNTVSTDFVDWDVEGTFKWQQGKNVFSSMLRKEISEDFQSKTVRNWHGKRKVSKIFWFSLFWFNFYQNSDRLRELECWNA